MTYDHRQDFLRKGRYKRLRELYFKKRSKEREYELEELYRDVDYIIGETQRLQRRVKRYNLIARPLVWLSIQLGYRFYRPQLRKDLDTFRLLAEKFHITPERTKAIIFNPEIAGEEWLSETEGGKEPDFYVPPDAVGPRAPVIMIKNTKTLYTVPRHELERIIISLSNEVNRLKKDEYTTMPTKKENTHG